MSQTQILASTFAPGTFVTFRLPEHWQISLKGLRVSARTAPEGSGPPEIKSLVGGITGGSHGSQSGGPKARPVSVLIECCCGPNSLLGKEAAELPVALY